MKALALKSTSDCSPARKQKKAEGHAVPVLLWFTQPAPALDCSVIHRKSACACGGGCPACQATINDLRVSRPNDPAEIEADHIAERVMRMPADVPVTEKNHSHESDKLQAKCSACEEEQDALETIPRKEGFASAAPTPPPDDGPPSVRNVINPGGRPLDFATRSLFEPRLGFDLSHVRVHTDSTANQSARAIDARSYTLGNNIVFGSGEYRPGTGSGNRLLAHELAHVAQQGSVPKKIYRDRDPAFSIEELFEDRTSIPNFIFFDLSEPDDTVTPQNDIDSDERDKIRDFAAAHTSGIELYGFASEEGGEADNADLIARRLQAVRNVLTAPPINYDPALISTNSMQIYKRA